jgi:two-component sensor histidine kinase
MDSSRALQYQNPKEAIRWAEKASYLAGQTGLKLSRGHAEFQISRIYTSQGQTKTAKEHALLALKIYEETSFDQGLQKVLLNLGHMHIKDGSYKQGEKYYRDALVIADKLQDTLSQGYIYQGLGNRFYFEDSLKEAAKYMLLSEEKLLSLNKKSLLGGLYVNLGNIQQNLDQLGNAKEYYEKAYDIFKENKDMIKQAIVAYNLGDIELKRNQDRKALFWYQKVLDIGKKASSVEDIKYGYLGLSKAYENMGSYVSAYDCLEKYHHLKDSIDDLNQQRKVDELEAKYLQEKKDKETAEKNKQMMEELIEKEELIKAQDKRLDQEGETRKYLVFAGVVLLLLLIISYLANQRFKRRNQLIRDQNKLIDKNLKEKEILLKEIHHRVKNNLQMISSLLNLQIHSIESDEARFALEDSMGRVRAIASVHTKLYNNENLAFINIKEYLTDLVSQQFPTDRKGRKVNYHLDVADHDINLDTAVPLGLIISELISNSLKHAFEETEEPEISIELQHADGEKCRLSFKDNGSGLDKNFDKNQSNSLGFEIVYTLSEQLEGEFRIHEVNNGVHFTLDFNQQH